MHCKNRLCKPGAFKSCLSQVSHANQTGTELGNVLTQPVYKRFHTGALSIIFKQIFKNKTSARKTLE